MLCGAFSAQYDLEAVSQRPMSHSMSTSVANMTGTRARPIFRGKYQISRRLLAKCQISLKFREGSCAYFGGRPINASVGYCCSLLSNYDLP